MRRFMTALAVALLLATAACSTTVERNGQPASKAGTATSARSTGQAPPKQVEYTGPAPAAGMGALSGRVVWNEQPVAKSAVRLCQDVSTFSGCKGTKYDTTTGNDGRYLITDVKPGEYTIMVKAAGMDSYVFARTLSMDGDTIAIESGKGVDVGDFPLVRFDLKMTSPADGTHVKQAKPTLTWVAYQGASEYEIALMPEHGKSVFTSERTSKTSIAPPEALLSCEYSWWVEAYNANGTQIGESEEHFRFTVEGQSASCTVDVTAPADHAVVGATGVTIKWNAHPLADHYTLHSWRGSDSSNPILDFLEVNATSYTIPNKLAAGEYVYFVNAVDANGDIIATNDARYFTVR